MGTPIDANMLRVRQEARLKTVHGDIIRFGLSKGWNLLHPDHYIELINMYQKAYGVKLYLSSYTTNLEGLLYEFRLVPPSNEDVESGFRQDMELL